MTGFLRHLDVHAAFRCQCSLCNTSSRQQPAPSRGDCRAAGTNFLIRANAFQECGWSPTWTLTEDFALGMELKKRGWQVTPVLRGRAC